jgi:hypothetical protein
MRDEVGRAGRRDTGTVMRDARLAVAPALSPTARAHEQALGRIDLDLLRSYSTQAQYEDMQASLARARERLAGGAVWHVNADTVGGVAETLHAVLGLMRDGGINARWALLEAGDDFFELTQRLYEDLSGVAHEFSSADRALHEGVLASGAAELSEVVVDGDVVVLYDPPAAGLAPALSERGASVIWRCHVGTDAPDVHGTSAQEFLRPYLDPVRTCLFARASFAWPRLGSGRTSAVHSSINPISAKNQELEPNAVTAILAVVGLTDEGDGAAPVFTRLDGSPWRVNRPAAIDQEAPLRDSAPVIAHVSSWDRGERGRRQRDPAPRGRVRPQELLRGLRPRDRREHVEAQARGRVADRRHRGSGRGGRVRHLGRPERSRGVRRRDREARRRPRAGRPAGRQ